MVLMKMPFEPFITTLNHPRYHAFTADNQDYLAYICLMLGTSLFQFPVFVQDIQDGTMRSFLRIHPAGADCGEQSCLQPG